MSEIKLNFDNSDVGDIDRLITEKFFDEDNELYKLRLNIDNNLIINVFKFKNKFPLLINKIKKYFSVNAMNYNIVSIDNIKYYAYMNNNNVPLKEYVKTVDIKYELSAYHIKKNLAFNWLMCITLNCENNFYVFSTNIDPFIADMKNAKNVSVKFINEKNFKTDITNHSISKVLLNKYFKGSEEEFQKTVKKLVNEVDVDIFRIKVKEIIQEIDPELIPWLNSVYNNIVFAKGFVFEN